jgi:hypothetical protein
MSNISSDEQSLSAGQRVLVYLINGNKSLLIAAAPHWRRVIKHKGKLCVRNCGLVPLVGKTDTGAWHT